MVSTVHLRPFSTKETTITRTFPPDAARPFAFTAIIVRLTFLNGKTFDFAVSDQLKITYITTDESIPVKAVMAGNYSVSAPRQKVAHAQLVRLSL